MPFDEIDKSLWNIIDLWTGLDVENRFGILYVSFYAGFKFKFIQTATIILPNFLLNKNASKWKTKARFRNQKLLGY